jgi:hypothetical protein
MSLVRVGLPRDQPLGHTDAVFKAFLDANIGKYIFIQNQHNEEGTAGVLRTYAFRIRERSVTFLVKFDFMFHVEKVEDIYWNEYMDDKEEFAPSQNPIRFSTGVMAMGKFNSLLESVELGELIGLKYTNQEDSRLDYIEIGRCVKPFHEIDNKFWKYSYGTNKRYLMQKDKQNRLHGLSPEWHVETLIGDRLVHELQSASAAEALPKIAGFDAVKIREIIS